MQLSSHYIVRKEWFTNYETEHFKQWMRMNQIQNPLLSIDEWVGKMPFDTRNPSDAIRYKLFCSTLTPTKTDEQILEYTKGKTRREEYLQFVAWFCRLFELPNIPPGNEEWPVFKEKQICFVSDN